MGITGNLSEHSMGSDASGVSARRSAVACAVLAAACYGIGTPLSKLLLVGLSPYMMAAALYLGAGLGMLVVRVAKGRGARGRDAREARLARGDLPYAAAMVALDVAAPIFLMLGLSLSAASTVWTRRTSWHPRDTTMPTTIRPLSTSTATATTTGTTVMCTSLPCPASTAIRTRMPLPDMPTLTRPTCTTGTRTEAVYEADPMPKGRRLAKNQGSFREGPGGHCELRDVNS
jgi:hypothetical protein